VKVGLQINHYDYHADGGLIRDDLFAIAEAAETAGFDSFWVMDHFWQLAKLGPAEAPMMEAYTTLGFLAGITERVTLGALVTGATYRAPALLIKAVTALDVLSKGRAYLGIGAGWNAEEASGLGLMNPLVSDRFARLEEILQLAKQMWRDDDSAYEGRYYRLARPLNRPQPVSKPHPPILVGGAGERRTLRLVAQYADACNLVATDLSELRHKLDVLREHCAVVGREYEEIERTAIRPGLRINDAANDLDAATEYIRQLHALGIQHVVFDISRDLDLSAYGRLARLVDHAHTL
jgi:F420-dependent oxidoreductase-like protein